MEGTLLGIAGTLLAAAGAFYLAVRIASARRRRSRRETGAAGRPAATGSDTQVIAGLVKAGRFKEAMDLLIAKGDFKGAARVALRMQEPLRAAELFERAGDFEAAALAFQRIPDHRRAAECFARAGNHEKAAEVYVQIGDLWAAAEELVALGRRKQAAALHRQLGNEILAARLTGEALREEGDFKGAAEAFTQAGELVSAAECLARSGSLREAAQTYQMAGRPDLAAASLEQAGAIPEAAALYEEAGNHAAAARLYQRIQDPSREVSALVRAGEFLAAGRLAYKLGDRARAEEVLKLASPADRGYTRVCLLLGRILEETGRLPEALKYYALFAERAEATPKTRSAFEYLAALFEREGQLENAVVCLRKLEQSGQLQPRHREVLANLMQRLERIGTTDRGTKAAPEPAQAPLDPRLGIPQQLSDRYSVVSRLGEGGTAVVVLAHDRVLMRNVVLKILSNPSLPGDLAEEYFMREARIVAQMSHPNIVTVFDVGNAAGRMYIVMEYIEGKSLDTVLEERKHRGLPLEAVVAMAQQLAEALGYAHERQVIHRDLKPGNVMVLPDGHVKLMDFGMAKALEVHRDRSLYICGTPDYMSPEQEAGEDLTPATDIYSFGLLLLEALLGSLPSAMTAAAAREKRIEALDRSALPAGVKQVLRSCLALNPADRPRSAREVSEALARAARR